eukprot:7391126-Prymnesium_polylepis.1
MSGLPHASPQQIGLEAEGVARRLAVLERDAAEALADQCKAQLGASLEETLLDEKALERRQKAHNVPLALEPRRWQCGLALLVQHL